MLKWPRPVSPRQRLARLHLEARSCYWPTATTQLHHENRLPPADERRGASRSFVPDRHSPDGNKTRSGRQPLARPLCEPLNLAAAGMRSAGEAGSCGGFRRHAACRARVAVPPHLAARRHLRASVPAGARADRRPRRPCLERPGASTPSDEASQ